MGYASRVFLAFVATFASLAFGIPQVLGTNPIGALRNATFDYVGV